MSTGSDIVTDALFACGALGQGDALPAADAQLCLRRLNRMLDSWNNVRQMTFETVFDTFTASAGVQQYSSTLLTNGRPISIDSMYARLNSVDYPIEMVGDTEWSKIPYKIVQSVPRLCWLDTSYPNSTFNLFPIPDQTYTVYVGVPKQLTNAIALATTISMPPGYEKAMVDCLAEDVAPSFGRPVTPDMARMANAARQVLRGQNYVAQMMDGSPPQAGRYTLADFYAGR